VIELVSGEKSAIYCCCVVVAVMEVACGEYGDMVPPLVVAVQNNLCTLYQTVTGQHKLTNCDKTALTTTTTSVWSVTTSRCNTLQPGLDDVTGAGDVTVNDVDGDDGVDCGVSLLHKAAACQRRAVPTLVLANGDVSCDVTLLKDVSKSSLSNTATQAQQPAATDRRSTRHFLSVI